MHRILFAFLVLVSIPLACAQKPEVDQEHMRWIDGVLRSISTVKQGMTRKDLSTVFVTEGGISTRTQRNYVYRQCPYIKVTVYFEPTNDAATNFNEDPSDKIVAISHPFLQYSIMD